MLLHRRLPGRAGSDPFYTHISRAAEKEYDLLPFKGEGRLVLMSSPITDYELRLDLLARAGALMLENGAATYRVDETLTHLGHGLGFEHIEIFATPTGIVLGADCAIGHYVRVTRISRLGVNMNRLAAISGLSRQAAAGALGAEEIAAAIIAIEQEGSQYPTWVIIGGVALACGMFALLFGSGWREFAAAALGAALTMALRLAVRHLSLVPLVVTVIAAFVATAASTIACRSLACQQLEIVQVAAVLQLVPGVPMVTWAIDLATGDILSGISRAAYAALITMGIALGMLLFLFWGLGR